MASSRLDFWVFEKPAVDYPALFKLRDQLAVPGGDKPFCKTTKFLIKSDFEQVATIVDYAKQLFDQYKFNCLATDGLVEYSWYHGHLPASQMPFSIHQDDYGGVPFEVATCIFYLEKTLSGADLEFYEPGWFYPTLHKKVQVAPGLDQVKVVLFEGNLLHYVNPITSDGDRHAIVVQLKSIRD